MQLALSGRVEFLLPCIYNPLRSKQQLPWKKVWFGVYRRGEHRPCIPAWCTCGEARFLSGAVLKLTLSLHQYWILRAASRPGPRPKLLTVHTQDWVEGEPVSIFTKSALNEFCVFSYCTGRSLHAVPAASALVATAHDWQAHKISQALPQFSPATGAAGIIDPLQLKTRPASIPSLVSSAEVHVFTATSCQEMPSPLL